MKVPFPAPSHTFNVFAVSMYAISDLPSVLKSAEARSAASFAVFSKGAALNDWARPFGVSRKIKAAIVRHSIGLRALRRICEKGGRSGEPSRSSCGLLTDGDYVHWDNLPLGARTNSGRTPNAHNALPVGWTSVFISMMN